MPKINIYWDFGNFTWVKKLTKRVSLFLWGSERRQGNRKTWKPKTCISGVMIKFYLKYSEDTRQKTGQISL